MNDLSFLRYIGTSICLGGMVLLPFIALLFAFYLVDRKTAHDSKMPTDQDSER
ncbi:MAG: hypothetical protein RLP44_26215 [Aggregatilineales bacterium]